MLIKNLIILLLFTSTTIFSQEAEQYDFSVSFTASPMIIEDEIPRGIHISWKRSINNLWGWGFATRMLNDSFTSIYAITDIKFNISQYFQIPIEVGSGIKVKQFNMDSSSEEGFNTFLHSSIAFKWFFDTNWSYFLSGDYNYNLLYGQSSDIYINLGVNYKF